MRALSPNHWTAREFPPLLLLRADPVGSTVTPNRSRVLSPILVLPLISWETSWQIPYWYPACVLSAVG